MILSEKSRAPEGVSWAELKSEGVSWVELKSEGVLWAELKSEGVPCGRSFKKKKE